MEDVTECKLSIAEMIRDAANEVLHSRVPEGFQWVEDYGQYYSPNCGFFYDPNTSLFYHHDSETYYVFNDDTQQYEVYKCMRKTKWTSRSNRKKAKKMFAEALDRFDQDAVDVCEVLFDLTSMLSLDEKKEKANDPESSSRALYKDDTVYGKAGSSTDYFDEATGEIITIPDKPLHSSLGLRSRRERRTEQRREIEGVQKDDDTCLAGDISDSSEEEDERIQMRKDEGFSQAPLLRIIDSKNNLHVITICGGTVGSQTNCDIILDDPLLPQKILEFVFVAESNSFVVNKVTEEGNVSLNDYELKANDERELEHGDFLRFGFGFLRIHVHYGNNTCTGCEPGLLQFDLNHASQSVVVPHGETARRRNLKAIKAMYGINDYAENARNLHYGFDRAAKRRKLAHSVMDINESPNSLSSNDIYQGCAAKPVPGAVVPSKFDPIKPLNETNKGFRLLQNMGWKEGEGLGKTGQGRQQLIESNVRNDRQGLGAVDIKVQPKSRKNVILEKTKQRYEKLVVS
ncbi:hypothetical protein RB195_001356 [Necator americanus]|uniref:G-patch domain-containing protein n=1 Tax=Necator americanus TaxID=51031 RepID=A0ABR1DF55_NECAM